MAEPDPPVTDGTPTEEGKPSALDMAEFRLCPKEPSRDLMWTLGAMGVVAAIIAISGGLDGHVLFWGGAFAIFAFILARIDETRAVEDRSVKVRISRKGIAISEKFGGTIGWEGIERITSSAHKGQVTLTIVPTELEAQGLAPQSGWSKFLHGKGLHYNITALEGDPEEVLGAIRWLAPRRLTDKL